LNTALQQQLFSKLRPVLLPAKNKQVSKPHANEYAEMWRAAAALERVDAKSKEALAEVLLKQVKRPPVPTHAYWALTRLGARVPLYGPLNTVVHPEVAGGWVEQLLAAPPEAEGEKLGWAFALTQLARRSGLRAVDLADDERHRVVTALRGLKTPPTWPRMVEDVVRPEGADRSDLFGESLPIGLRLASG
jgi:DNA-K related protein